MNIFILKFFYHYLKKYGEYNKYHNRPREIRFSFQLLNIIIEILNSGNRLLTFHRNIPIIR